MSWYDAYLSRGKVDRSANTTPGNKKGGLSNIVEKAMGSIVKSPMTAVWGYRFWYCLGFLWFLWGGFSSLVYLSPRPVFFWVLFFRSESFLEQGSSRHCWLLRVVVSRKTDLEPWLSNSFFNSRWPVFRNPGNGLFYWLSRKRNWLISLDS